MNNLYADNHTKFCEDETESIDTKCEGDIKPLLYPVSSRQYCVDLKKKFQCYKSTCSGLHFNNKEEYQSHILLHITQPKVVINRIDVNILQKPCETVRVQCKTQPDDRNPLRVKLKLKSTSGSQKRSFEIIQNSVVLSGPDGLVYTNGLFEACKTELLETTNTSSIEHFSERELTPTAELDGLGENAREGEEVAEEGQREERDQEVEGPKDEVTSNDIAEDERRSEERENESSEEEEEDDEEEERNSRKTVQSGSRWDIPEGTSISEVRPQGTLSPTPSEVLRPVGLLAPEVEDEDSRSQSSSHSSSRMVEMNGSASAIGSSDNDSGHSRSPATFPGNSNAGSVTEEVHSGQQGFNWDELVNQSTNVNNRNEENGSQHGDSTVNNDQELTSTAENPSSILENDPLLISENAASTENEENNINLLQNLTSDPLQTDGDRGDTEYMSLDRLGEAAFCCEVCGERTQDRRVLEEHRAVAGHYKCMLMPECNQMVWGTLGELTAHQSNVHRINPTTRQSPEARPSPPQLSGPRSAGTPPVQQLAQQVQRLPIPQQGGYPVIAPAQYPMPVPQQQLSPQLPPQVSTSIVTQMPPHQMPPHQMPPQMPPQMPAAAQPRPPMPYRMPMQGQPFAAGSPGRPQVPPYPQPPQYTGTIQPRSLNSMVATQPNTIRGQVSVRMPQAMNQQQTVVRGMVAAALRAPKRVAMPPQPGRVLAPPLAKQVRMEAPHQPESSDPAKKSDAKAVANILATRGITVTPAGVARTGVTPQVAAPRPRQRQPVPTAAPPQPVTTLNLNSAISIIPTSANNAARQQQNNSGFAVPQGRSIQRQPQTTNVERPPRPPTVDLTGDGPTPPPGSTRLQMSPAFHRGRGRPSNLSRTTCQICDKAFTSPEVLNQHMAMHRNPGKLPYRCNLCSAQYPTQAGLQQHRQTYHKESVSVSPAALVPGEEMVIPLVDLKQPGVAARLGALGIHHCIPLSGLGNQSNGYFSLPVVSIDGSRTSAAGNLRSLGASGVLSIGPIKLVPR